MACSYSPSGNFVASGGLDDVCTIFSLKTESGTPALKKRVEGHKGTYINFEKSFVFVDHQSICKQIYKLNKYK